MLNQPNKKYTCLNRRHLLKLICLAGAGLLISACDHQSADPSQNNEVMEISKMQSTKDPSTIRQQIPPLDVLEPKGIKTATFALG